MADTFGWSVIEDALIRLGDALQRPTFLTVIGSSVSMSLGQPGRMTLDVDVWKKTSRFDLGDLKCACEKAGIEFNPTADHPSRVYLQLVDPGVVQLGEFEALADVSRMGQLTIQRPPLENIIASKLVRGDARDYDDIVFLIARCGVTRTPIDQAVATIRDPISRETAQENLVMLEVALNTPSCSCETTHKPTPRPR